MPPSHQRHRRSPFKRTSFRRTSSGSSSLRSFSEVQSRSNDRSDDRSDDRTNNKPQLSDPKSSGRENENVLIRNMVTDKNSVIFHPTVTVTICQDEIAVMRKEDGDTSQSQPQSQTLRRENTIGEMEGKDTSPTFSSIYSTNTLGYPTMDPDKDADNGSYTSCSSILTIPGLSLQTSTSRSAVSVSNASFLNVLGRNDGELGISMANSRMERWKAFGKARGFLGGRRVGDGDGDEEGEGNELKTGKEKCEKKIRPFLRKYCLHPFSMRSSFRLVGWIEDPVGCCVGHGTAYGTGYAYGG
ncbi:hypothetical protein BCON_0150g00110 [Botryotinia convoluta]|uniref:Uncharacterized protein n=1 Tax=Botryotinia convoluta TaxID=54673 RepID=A0A4Z1HSA9_9HELO|nr:hypothetical protein BCON_0150g00110 [Botryotinia convoluta]